MYAYLFYEWMRIRVKCFLDILREFKQQVLFHAESFVQNAGIWGIYVYKINYIVEL